MKINHRHEADMHGVHTGIDAGVGGPLEMEVRKRSLKQEDIIAIICTGDRLSRVYRRDTIRSIPEHERQCCSGLSPNTRR